MSFRVKGSRFLGFRFEGFWGLGSRVFLGVFRVFGFRGVGVLGFGVGALRFWGLITGVGVLGFCGLGMLGLEKKLQGSREQTMARRNN